MRTCSYMHMQLCRDTVTWEPAGIHSHTYFLLLLSECSQQQGFRMCQRPWGRESVLPCMWEIYSSEKACLATHNCICTAEPIQYSESITEAMREYLHHPWGPWKFQCLGFLQVSIVFSNWTIKEGQNLNVVNPIAGSEDLLPAFWVKCLKFYTLSLSHL